MLNINVNEDIIELRNAFADFRYCEDAEDVMKAVDRLDISRETTPIGEPVISESEIYGGQIRTTEVRGGFVVHGGSGRSYSGTWYGTEVEYGYDAEDDEYSFAEVSPSAERIEINGRTYFLQ